MHVWLYGRHGHIWRVAFCWLSSTYTSTWNSEPRNSLPCDITKLQNSLISQCSCSSSEDSKFGNGMVVGCGLFKKAEEAKCVSTDLYPCCVLCPCCSVSSWFVCEGEEVDWEEAAILSIALLGHATATLPVIKKLWWGWQRDGDSWGWCLCPGYTSRCLYKEPFTVEIKLHPLHLYFLKFCFVVLVLITHTHSQARRTHTPI